MSNTRQRINSARQLSQATLPALEQEMGYAEITSLKPAHEVFVWEYVLSGASAQLAYQRAYPESAERSAQNNGSRLLKTSKIQSRIAEIRSELQNRYGITAFDVFRLLATTMILDRRQYVDKAGEPLKLHQLNAEAASITDIEITLDRHGQRHAIPVIPRRMAAAEALAKIMGLNKDRVEFSGSTTAAVNIYIPDNGRDDFQEREAEKMKLLRERFDEVLGKSKKDS